MTTWTPATQQAETWTQDPPITSGIFSPYVFSRQFVGGKRLFAMMIAGDWLAKTNPSTTWTPK